ncbi:MAG TPA: DUF2142 domain-containing protein, partial [bacterium]|nr:DUF2142 domain-containing protein [bacterium]
MTRSWPARALTSPLAVPVCLLVAFAVLGSVWALGRPYGVTTDEEAHYVRALGLSTGDVTGEASVWPDRAFTPEQQRTLDAATRRFRMPERVAPRRNPTGGSIFSCFAFQPTRPASCITDPSGPVLQETYVGVYPPLPYLLPGVVARGAGDPVWGLLLARLGSGVLCLVVLALCVWGVRDPDAPALSLLGVTVALTPTVMFFAWSMNAGGLEMASGIAFVALCLRLARPQRPPSWMWGATAVSGLLLGGSRPIALVWVFFGLWVA